MKTYTKTSLRLHYSYVHTKRITLLLLITVLTFVLITLILPGCRKNAGTDTTNSKADQPRNTLNQIKPPTAQPAIAVTSSYLLAALQEIYPHPDKIICLAPPGSCPGHFDISPATIKKLADCDVLFRFTFQHALDGKLSYFTQRGLKIYSIPVGQGMCIPDTYLAVCQNVCTTMQRLYPQYQADYQQRLAHSKRRLHKLSLQLRNRINKFQLTNQPVLASIHQAAFARWLGLNVAGTFTSSELATISSIENSLRQARTSKVKYIIANTPTSVKVARTLAEKTTAQMVIFSNFPIPATTTPHPTDNNNNNTQARHIFDTLLQNNVDTLIRAYSHSQNGER